MSPDRKHALNTFLMQDLLEATARANAASDEFSGVRGEIPSGLPHPDPDGVQRLNNASRELSQARKEVMNAHTRINDFISRGIVPEDLKQGSGG